MVCGEALIEPGAFDQGGNRTGQVAERRVVAKLQFEVRNRALQLVLETLQPLRVLGEARAADALAPEPVRDSAQPERPEEAIVDSRLGRVPGTACGLPSEERIDPRIGRCERGEVGKLDARDPVAGAERHFHRLRLELRLATEEIRDRPAGLPIPRGNGIRVEARKRPDGNRALVEQLGVAADLLQSGELADLDVALTRLVLGERRAVAGGALVGDESRTSDSAGLKFDTTLGDTYRTYLRTYGTYAPTEGRLMAHAQGRTWLVTVAATVASTYALDAVATLAGIGLAASTLLAGIDHRLLIAVLVGSYALWAVGLRANLIANSALLEQTGVSTSVASKALYAMVAARTRNARRRRFAAAAGYVGTEVVKELPYYSGAFAASLTDSVSAGDAIIFLAGANAGAAAYEYGLARITRAFLRRRPASHRG